MPIQPHTTQTSNLLEVLEKILDKGVVIAGDIKISLADVDLLTIKIRLLIASVDKAREIGMDWWENDSYYSSKGRLAEKEHVLLNERMNRLEQLVEEKALPLQIEEKVQSKQLEQKVLPQQIKEEDSAQSIIIQERHEHDAPNIKKEEKEKPEKKHPGKS
jgi:hypothetical protein